VRGGEGLKEMEEWEDECDEKKERRVEYIDPARLATPQVRRRPREQTPENLYTSPLRSRALGEMMVVSGQGERDEER